jgi:uncharacterized Tic20 family protein
MPNDQPHSFRERSLAALCHLSTLSWSVVLLLYPIIWFNYLSGLSSVPEQTVSNVMLASLALPPIISIVIWVRIDKSYLFAKTAVVEVFNVYLSFLCYLLIILLIGMLFTKVPRSLTEELPIYYLFGYMILFMIFTFVSAIQAMIKAFKGQEFRYPLIIRFITSR